MTKFFAPVLLLGLSIAVFFGFIDPTYQTIKGINVESASYDQALNNSKQLQAVRDALLARYNSFNADDLTRLQELVPDTVDNVRLVLDIDHIASNYGMILRNVKVSEAPKDQKNSFGPDTRDYGSVILTFSISSTYQNLVSFIRDLEASLRLVDITSVAFKSTDKDFSDYEISIKTYWLK